MPNLPRAKPSRGRHSYETCPVTKFQKLTNGRHKLRIVWELREKPLRYGELKRAVNAVGAAAVAERVFGRELKALTKSNLVERRHYAGTILRVEYRLTPLGYKLIPLIGNIAKWGLRNLKDTQ